MLAQKCPTGCLLALHLRSSWGALCSDSPRNLQSTSSRALGLGLSMVAWRSTRWIGPWSRFARITLPTNLIKVSRAMEIDARNTMRNKGTSNWKEGDACLTCMVRTRLVVMREAIRTHHDWSAEVRQTGVGTGRRNLRCSDWAVVVAGTRRATCSTRVIQRALGVAEWGFRAAGRVPGCGVVTTRFMQSLKHTYVGQTKFIIPKS